MAGLRSHPLSLSLSLSPLTRFNYPDAGGQAGSSGCILLHCTVCTPLPSTLYFLNTVNLYKLSRVPPTRCPVTVLALVSPMVCILYSHNISQARPSYRISQTDSQKQSICRNIQMCLTSVRVFVPTITNDFFGIEL